MQMTDLLGALVQNGMSNSTRDRVRSSFGGQQGGGDLLGSLAGMLGQGGGGGGAAGALGGVLSSVLGGQKQGGSAFGGGGGAIGDVLGSLLGGQGNSAGKNLAIGGLTALASAFLGKQSGMTSKTVGNGVMALLATMAFQALTKSPDKETPKQIPLGLREPENSDEEARLEQKAGIMLQAMINAAKADGQIDAAESQRILGKLQESGADQSALDHVRAEMGKPMNTEALVAAVGQDQQMAAEMYAASLLAIEVDTPAEQAYLNGLVEAFGLGQGTAKQIQSFVGMAA